MCAKIMLKIVRSFSVGFTIYSPKMNGMCFDISIACFTLSVWSRGRIPFAVENYWTKQY